MTTRDSFSLFVDSRLPVILTTSAPLEFRPGSLSPHYLITPSPLAPSSAAGINDLALASELLECLLDCLILFFFLWHRSGALAYVPKRTKVRRHRFSPIE